MKRNAVLSLFALIVLTGIVMAFVFLVVPRGATGDEAPFLARFRHVLVPEAGTSLPDLTFKDPQGRPIALSAFRGRPLVLNIWAAWCPPCLEELPSFQTLHDRLAGDSVAVLAVSADTAYTPESVRRLGARYGFGNVAFYHDFQSQFQEALALYALPVTFIVDPEGRIVYRLEGEADWASDEAGDFLKTVGIPVRQAAENLQ